MPASFTPPAFIRPALVLLVAITLSGCASGEVSADAAMRDATAGVVIATAADADALIPPLVTSTAGKQVVDLLFDHLAVPVGTAVNTLGDAGFAPQLAARWEWAADSMSIAFTVHPEARWHDGVPVTASDVAFSFWMFTAPEISSFHARAYEGIDSVIARDAHTAVVWWTHRHPEQFFQIAYNLAIMPKHLLQDIAPDALLSSDFASHPVGSGRYRFESWSRRQQLILVADSTNYRGQPRFDRVIWSVLPDPNAATMALMAGQADVLEVLRGDAVSQASRNPALQTIEYGSLDYGYLMFNLRPSTRRPVSFSDRNLRIALSMLINRAAVVQNALDSLGQVALGPVTRADPTVDPAMHQIPFDTARAAQVLDSLGWRWRKDRSGRVRNKTPLTFSVMTPSSSGTRNKLAVLLQAELARAGVKLEIESVEPVVFASRLTTGDFDTALGAWRNDPSPASIRQSWGSPVGNQVGANFGRYASTTFDAALDSAVASFDQTTRTAYFRRAYQQIVDDAPAIWLYEPRNLAGVRATLVPTAVRADAWLAGLADWSVNLTPAVAGR